MIIPVCVKCSRSFPNRKTIDGKLKNLSSRKYCLQCSPFGKHNTVKIHKAKPRSKSKYCICDRCGRRYLYSRDSGHRLTRCNACLQRVRQRRIKQRAADFLGGKCILCGYSRCIEALDFHHRDPSKKDYTIGHMYNRAWARIEEELRKCVLICATCHREVHSGLVSIPGVAQHGRATES